MKDKRKITIFLISYTLGLITNLVLGVMLNDRFKVW